jgi:hypothetical protein
MIELQKETTLAKARLHWGMFIPVLLLAFFPIFASLPFMFLFHRLVGNLHQIGMHTTPRLELIWLGALVPFLRATHRQSSVPG